MQGAITVRGMHCCSITSPRHFQLASVKRACTLPPPKASVPKIGHPSGARAAWPAGATAGPALSQRVTTRRHRCCMPRVLMAKGSGVTTSRSLSSGASTSDDPDAATTTAVEALRAWVVQSGGSVHEAVTVGDAGIGRGPGLQAIHDIEVGQTLVSLPRECMLTSDLAAVGRDPQLEEAMASVPSELWPARLGLLLLSERARGDESPWAPYIRLLPLRYDGIPIFFGVLYQYSSE